MIDITDSWNKLYQFRKRIRKRFPSLWQIKVIKKPSNIVKSYLRDNIRVLDIGAGNRQIGEKVKELYPTITYKSMDVDRKMFQDYYTLEEIKEKYNLILLFEVIEHIEFKEAVEMLKKIRGLLHPGGRLILTTPNVFHPHRYWEYSHKVSYRYDEIGGLLLALGYEVGHIYRIYNNAFIPRIIRLYLAAPIHYYFNIDFAESIAIVAKA